MGYSSFLVVGVLSLQVIFCSAGERCTVQSGVKTAACPGGGGGGQGQGGGGGGGQGTIEIIPCTFYEYSGPQAQTYEIKNLQPNERYHVLIDDMFVVGTDVISLRTFLCKHTDAGPEECVVYNIDRNAWPPIMLKEGKHKRICINGGKHSKLKFKIVTAACKDCEDWKYDCKEPFECTRDGGMYLKKPLGNCPGDKVCCLARDCAKVHFEFGKRCVPRDTLPPFPKQCPAECQTTFKCAQGTNCCDLCEAYNGIYTCKAAGECPAGKVTDNKCCVTPGEVCCRQQ